MSLKPFDLVLAAIFLACLALILVAQEPWLKVLYDVAVGSLISLIFYVLVVRLPDYQRLKRIKRSFATQYNSFKKDCIRDILSVSDGTFTSDLIDRLMEQSQFSEYFKQNVSSSQDRWDAFQNNLNEYYLRELMVNMEASSTPTRSRSRAMLRRTRWLFPRLLASLRSATESCSKKAVGNIPGE
jgi:hypothetical protein